MSFGLLPIQSHNKKLQLEKNKVVFHPPQRIISRSKYVLLPDCKLSGSFTNFLTYFMISFQKAHAGFQFYIPINVHFFSSNKKNLENNTQLILSATFMHHKKLHMLTSVFWAVRISFWMQENLLKQTVSLQHDTDPSEARTRTRQLPRIQIFFPALPIEQQRKSRTFIFKSLKEAKDHDKTL